MTPDHARFMARALQLAERGRYTTHPNPRVGCVLVREVDGVAEIVAEGWHQRAGEGHAEVNALAQIDDAGGLTAYVTLEPCNHQGRTGPCSEALIAAGIGRVVYGMQDPNPKVAGLGLQRLRDAGVEVIGPVMQAQAEALNPGFIKRMRTGLPFVRVKLAMSLDGRTAMASGESQWITGPEARGDVQRLRAASSAIITGIDTVLHDDAALTVRAAQLELPDREAAAAAARQPLRVVLDRRSRLPQSARLLSLAGPVLLIQNHPLDYPDTVAEVETLALCDQQSDGGDLLALLQELAARECNEVLVEAGSRLAGSFMGAGLVDELIVYMAPTLLGSSARPLLQLPLANMAEQQRLDIVDVRAVGLDWRITARPVNNPE
ncbi:bifunctional diaminohydroxyphosphoribosylaminopyrimidine deaminase/5-amino-6-(5-phosphoribosylamino)uracil reductase RibD [Simiduia sp. 21SJ11W-1]|uniref:bifunctional diaminohydroxyphosphoribosylaminopyrimidine deaminase/5-amino-6-(5-phosphoribosylamino)uracil reductase RibD n=1 Tax=Simiduia sp. 21SJ11W-1 TaxID=2909669 RepID=UPI0020A0B9E2|nr:bifunctional diaminohydroxyphosphoribosylaminopyrimidine deaminase/5-amino-6-(5-phosphoribosylamino)uracil reductase RibD [Simiduia sp. 21SJ11W-1]UTA47526.1 bifunctional diaminohydroxyphosphoribosylaminopyrimidine deaminase/5-amino-6-(5-phosphoribosylamino)uracil reductase RibD [Simiduia sp. 21SJ11W-1]